ncbi:MAG: hypothetical protein U1F00_19015 [Rhodoferax sp.]
MAAPAPMLCWQHLRTHVHANGTRLAAVDLGSNSFRLEIVRLDHGQFERTEYLKETIHGAVRWMPSATSVPTRCSAAQDCLARFGEHLAGFKKAQVRAVATQTLQEARNRDVFLQRANAVLGFPIDVISGREEARLIYLGVAQMLPQSDERRLVADIGGRSTELILGQGFLSRARWNPTGWAASAAGPPALLPGGPVHRPGVPDGRGRCPGRAGRSA